MTPEPGTVHVWCASLGGAAALAERFRNELSADERDRAARFRLAVHRDRYIAGRGIVRDVLARYTGLAAGELSFSYGRHGKPSLAGAARRSGPSFSVSHSRDRVVCAVCRGRAVGVDIEAMRPVAEAAALAARFFGPGSGQALAALLPPGRDRALLEQWARREAAVKAEGGSIWGSRGSYDPSGPGEAMAALEAPGAGVGCRCHVQALALGSGCVGALATIGRDPVRVVVFEWAGRARGPEPGRRQA
jgi:4'-phosphopantetheinyl transferase